MSMKKSLEQIESMLATLVGGTVTKSMVPAEFVQYAHGQIVKAMSEPGARSTRRLKALHGSVRLYKDNYSGDENGVNVPVFVEDTTALDERESTLTSAAQVVAGTRGKTAFEQGLVSKFDAIKGQIDALMKELPDDDDEKEKRKAAGDEDEDEEEGEKRKAADDDDEKEKRKAAAGDDDDEPESEDEEKRAGKAKAPPPFPKKPFPPKKPEDDDDEKADAKKGIDRSRDGTTWPADLNTLKGAKVEKSLDWGRD